PLFPTRLSFDLFLLFMPFVFFYISTALPEIYPLSLHDALPILAASASSLNFSAALPLGVSSATTWLNLRTMLCCACAAEHRPQVDRKSTRLNSSHSQISYAVFCLKKKIKRSGCEIGRAHV